MAQDPSKTEFGFDAGYFSSENIRYCHDQGLDIYVPEGRGESGVKERKAGVIGSRDCKLEIDGDIRLINYTQAMKGRAKQLIGLSTMNVYVHVIIPMAYIALKRGRDDKTNE